jgi:hypothetical protein
MAKAGFNLDAFIGQNADYARGYTFYINVNGGFVGSEFQRYLVRSSSLPASTNDVAEVNWQGNVYKLGTTQSFAEFTVSYSVDINDDIRRQYVNWVTYIHNPEDNLHGNPNEYMQDVDLEHLSHTSGNVIMKYKLIKAFPSVVGEMTLDYSSKEVASFDVTFTYQYHISE